MGLQTSYSPDPVVGIKGQLAIPENACQIRTGVNKNVAVAKEYLVTFALTWAADDEAVTVVEGISVSTIAGAGEDTPAEVRDAHLADLLANAFIVKRWIVASSGSAAISIKARTPGEDFTVTTGETTAGDGTQTETVAVANAVDGDLEFGVGVVRDPTSEDRGVILPTETGQQFAGVVIHSHAYSNRDLSGQLGVPAGDAINVMQAGLVYLVFEQDVSPGDDVYLRHTVNGALSPGGWRKDADTAKADLIPHAQIESTATAGNIVKVRFWNTGKDRT